MAYAEEDPLEDEADVEGESEGDVEDLTTTEEEEEEVKTTTSPDADTTLLFVRPVQSGASLGKQDIYILLFTKLVHHLFL